ncbi:hypothetical protein [Swaminathania salitolerans]|uniref:Glycosyl transferase family 1 domain-containing protein n=1 Tax=Swaminathania salitolerans TaxID=182838 RepID=A0A511BQE2_9PROT|nr:hypothetical protein [Swaminathania salitolerans]GBQ11445.1 glycosyltransferase [Swaminathania salitolerans LMG 21291]GEL02485.1 hypothetical protein SSA02_16480 [Swaminathania salitolerans]
MQDDATRTEAFFDRGFYLQSYPDVATSGVDAFAHYCSMGWREGRNPNAVFDTRYYLTQNYDVASAGLNPLEHYAQSGRKEGRRPAHPLREQRGYVQNGFHLLASASGCATRGRPGERVLGKTELVSLLREAWREGPTVLSVSHDEFAKNVGGVQKLILTEEERCAETGWNYLHLAPAMPGGGLARRSPTEPSALAVRLNGRTFGLVTPHTLIAALQAAIEPGSETYAVIHHLMGHDPDDLGDIIDALKCRRVVAWVHDFYTLCSGIQLLRNDVVYCGAPEASSMACGICRHGQGREAFLARLATFFARFTPDVLAPSRAALAIWQESTSLTFRSAGVRALGRLLMAGAQMPYGSRSAGEKLRIAYLGHRVRLKGWSVFRDLAERFRHDPRYEFHHLGMDHGVVGPGNIIHTPVNIAEDGEDAMIRSVAALNIDAVLLWSLCAETFCYAAHEAIAAGAFLLAPRGPGNVPDLIREQVPEQGLLLDDETQLTELLRSGQIFTLLDLSPRQRGHLMKQGDTIAWLEELV